MEKKDGRTEKLSPEELKREADEIRALINNAKDLQNAQVTEEMHERMMERIRRYDAEKAIANLSKEDQEALRLGKALQNKRKARKARRWRTWAALAAALVIVCGMGITSVGGKNIIVEVLEKTFGTGDKTYVDSSKEITHSAGITEEQARVELKEVFGTQGIDMMYMPKNVQFIDMQLDKELQEAILYYSVGENIMSLRMISRYVESSIGMDLQDKLIRTYQMDLPETSVKVQEYLIPETGELEYTAQFAYKDCKYFLTGILEKSEFEKIIKNLHFF